MGPEYLHNRAAHLQHYGYGGGYSMPSRQLTSAHGASNSSYAPISHFDQTMDGGGAPKRQGVHNMSNSSLNKGWAGGSLSPSKTF